jgi:hypothetical protein
VPETDQAPPEPDPEQARAEASDPRLAAVEDDGQSAAAAPSPTAAEDGDANWVAPSVYVNLRNGPSSSAPIIGVIAKGTKLMVMSQKPRWVQVTNPETSESGWIYARTVPGLAGPGRGFERSDSDSESSESVWKRLRNWLTDF